MKSKNIPVNVKSKSIKEIKEEINHILEKLENNETDLSESTEDYQKMTHNHQFTLQSIVIKLLNTPYKPIAYYPISLALRRLIFS